MRIAAAILFAVLGVLSLWIAPSAIAAGSALGESKWSLEVGTWLGSGSYDGSIAVRRHTGANTAWRFAIDAYASGYDGDGTEVVTGLPDGDVVRWSDYHDYAFSLQWMHYASIRDGLAVTFGVGPFYETYVQASRDSYNAGQPSFLEWESRESRDLYGLDFGLGLEWFFSRRFSLGGQVGLRAGLGTSTVTSIARQDIGVDYTIDQTTIESDLARLDTSNGRILLSIYF